MMNTCLMKIKVILITIIFLLIRPNYGEAQVIDSVSLINFIKKENKLTVVEDRSIGPLDYTFYNELVNNRILNADHLSRVHFFPLVESDNRVNEHREYDFIVERWVMKDANSTNEVISVLEEVLYNSVYEKPPKIALVSDYEIYIVLTWGAVYRHMLYAMREKLIKKYKMKSL